MGDDVEIFVGAVVWYEMEARAGLTVGNGIADGMCLCLIEVVLLAPLQVVRLLIVVATRFLENP